VYSLTRLKAVAPNALVGIFPSDHHFKNNETLLGAVNEAFQHVESHGERIVLLGVAPDSPEDSYGWIEPGVRLHGTNAGPILEVRRFWEKPSPHIARNLMRAGGLWNSFIMIGRVSTFLRMIHCSVPNLISSFERMWEAVQPGMEEAALCEVFSNIPLSDFSDAVLSISSSDLTVLPVQGMGWTDLGEPERHWTASIVRGEVSRRLSVPLPSLARIFTTLWPSSMTRSRKKKKTPKRVLALSDLEQAKSAVLNTLTSKSGQRTYDHAITEFVEWYCSEPRLAFNRTVVLRYRISLEQRQYAPSTISLRIAAVRRIAYEAADSGLLSPELAAGISRVKGVRRLGVRVGNWLTAEQGKRCESNVPLITCDPPPFQERMCRNCAD
jgi:hypothetical protein